MLSSSGSDAEFLEHQVGRHRIGTKAEQATAKPGLRFEFHDTGYGGYETFLASLKEPAD